MPPVHLLWTWSPHQAALRELSQCNWKPTFEEIELQDCHHLLIWIGKEWRHKRQGLIASL